jgi:hypothetical protein
MVIKAYLLQLINLEFTRCRYSNLPQWSFIPPLFLHLTVSFDQNHNERVTWRWGRHLAAENRTLVTPTRAESDYVDLVEAFRYLHVYACEIHSSLTHNICTWNVQNTSYLKSHNLKELLSFGSHFFFLK